MNTMKPAPQALAWAMRQRFSSLACAQVIIEAHEAHLRILAKIKARNEKRQPQQ